jgi:hypothetical protein
MTNEVEANKGGLPTWAKILIGLVVVGGAGVIIASVGFFFFIKDMVQKAEDPETIVRTTKQIAEFQNPLPEGYKFEAAFTLMNVGTVIVQHPQDKQTLTLISFPKKENDPKAFVDRIIESGVDSGKSTAKLEEIKSRGDLDVAGVHMPYVIGKMADKSGKTFEGMVGCLVSPTKEKTLLVYGTQPLGTEYNVESTKQFLKAIKSF